MNQEQANEVLIKLWLEKAFDALASARLEVDEGHLGSRLTDCITVVSTR
jgi:hypothetical protein